MKESPIRFADGAFFSASLKSRSAALRDNSTYESQFTTFLTFESY